VLYDRDNEIDECCLDVCFASNFEVLGKLTQHELKPGGAQILVTDENKEEYLKCVYTPHLSLLHRVWKKRGQSILVITLRNLDTVS